MNACKSDGGLAGGGGAALADSLTTLRQLIDASRSDSLAGLVSEAVNALMQHQDFDGCMVFIGGDDGTRQAPPLGQRGTARMPGFLDPLVSAKVIPALMSEGSVFVEPRLTNRSPNGYGSLLGVPVSDGHHRLGGLIVWNQDADALMPWHQNLLEMLAELFVMALRRLGTIDDREQGRADGPLFRMPASGATQHDQNSVTSLVGIDRLVGLNDRQSFERSVEDLANTPASVLRTRYILFVDIDRFRLVREYGGEVTAERLIRVLSDLLRREMSGEELIGRLGADQFGVVIESRSREQVMQLAQSLIAMVDSLHLSFSGQRYDVSISVGVAELESEVGSGMQCLRRAMQACEAAQKQGGGVVLSYHDNLCQPRRSPGEGRLLNRLTRALKDDELELYAQPIAPLQNPVAGQASPYMHELLLRIRDDEGGLIGAGAFLPLAERYGLSVKLDRWVIRHAFSQIATSRFTEDSDHRFALNLSGHSINDNSLLEYIVSQFEQSGLPPKRICFEITETAAISDIRAAKVFVEDLQKLGCEFALDDFGSGHSSFLYLRDLPIDYLKIDGELVREIADDPVSLAFVRTIEGVARLMGRQTIAEFVENEAIRDAIAEIGCNYAQGYQMGHPVPLADVLKGPTE